MTDDLAEIDLPTDLPDPLEVLTPLADIEVGEATDDSDRPALATATLRILVFGSRNYKDRLAVWAYLNGHLAGLQDGETLGVISGMAPGADLLGYEWALEHPEVALGEFPADWDGLGKAAGFIRNKQMLDEGHPHLGLGFTDDLATSRGTSDMARRLEAARVPYLIIGKQKPPRR